MTETATTECIAYRRGNAVCANGFFQTLACWGDTRCHACGRHSESERMTPYCMRDELPEHWVKSDGSPAFYAGSPT